MTTATRTTRLVEQFSQNIREGVWSVDQIIPTEMELMRRYQAGRNTIRAALRQLEEKRWVKATPGVGRSVTPEALSRRGTLGLLVRGGELAEGQGLRVMQAIAQAANAQGYQLATLGMDFKHRALTQVPDTADPVVADLQQLDGALVLAQQYQPEDILRLAARMPVATLMSHNATSVRVPSFSVDYLAHTTEAIAALIRAGHRRITLLHQKLAVPSLLRLEIQRGFDLGTRLFGLPHDPARIIYWNADIHSPESLFEAWQQPAEKPTAVLSYLDAPLHILRAELDRHAVPRAEHPALICLADLSNRRESTPGMASFRVDLEQMARDAIDYLHRHLSESFTQRQKNALRESRIYPGTLDLNGCHLSAGAAAPQPKRTSSPEPSLSFSS